MWSIMCSAVITNINWCHVLNGEIIRLIWKICGVLIAIAIVTFQFSQTSTHIQTDFFSNTCHITRHITEWHEHVFFLIRRHCSIIEYFPNHLERTKLASLTHGQNVNKPLKHQFWCELSKIALTAPQVIGTRNMIEMKYWRFIWIWTDNFDNIFRFSASKVKCFLMKMLRMKWKKNSFGYCNATIVRLNFRKETYEHLASKERDLMYSVSSRHSFFFWFFSVPFIYLFLLNKRKNGMKNWLNSEPETVEKSNKLRIMLICESKYILLRIFGIRLHDKNRIMRFLVRFYSNLLEWMRWIEQVHSNKIMLSAFRWGYNMNMMHHIYSEKKNPSRATMLPFRKHS